MPPSAVYRPVRAITSTEPIQKLSIVVLPIVMCSSGRSVPKTTPPANIPTAIFDTMKVMIETIERTYRELTLNRRSRNSGMVKTMDRM